MGHHPASAYTSRQQSWSGSGHTWGGQILAISSCYGLSAVQHFRILPARTTCPRVSCPGQRGSLSDVGPVLKAWFVEQLCSILAAAGLPQQQYAGHSFRISAATTAALAGVEDSMIQTLGRWQSGAFLQYIRTPSETLANLSSVLVRRAS